MRIVRRRRVISTFSVCLSLLLTSCAGNRFEHRIQQLQPGVTSKEEVIKLFGDPKQYSENADGTADYVYTKAKRNVVKGATFGTLIAAALMTIPGILLVPFTFGASLLWIPAVALGGGVAGGLGGAAVKSAKELLAIHFNEQGIVESYKVMPADADERVFGID